MTINHLPDELLVEIFDFYRQVIVQSYHLWPTERTWWSITLEWFELIHVCKRWRTIMFASASRLGLCLILTPEKGGNMKTILSRHFPPLPIEIHYYRPVKTKDIGRMLAALKRPDRIRRIYLIASTALLNRFFKATKGAFPALETLELGDQNSKELKIPATFLKGPDLHLRSLKLHSISLPSASVSRLLSSTPALTNLYLVIDTDVSPPPAMSFLLSHLHGLPCLHHLDLEIKGFTDILVQPAEPEEFSSFSKLTTFRYHGHSTFLNTLLARFAAPSLQEVNIWLGDGTLPLIPHLPRFIEDIEEHYHAIHVEFHRGLSFSFLGHPGYAIHSPYFRCSNSLPESIMQMSSKFSARLATMQELFVIRNTCASGFFEDSIPWHRFFLQFPSVKALRLEGMSNRRIAAVLHQDHGGPNPVLFPALEEIELCTSRYWALEYERTSVLMDIFQPFASARQEAGLPVNVFCRRSLRQPWRFQVP